MSLSCPNYGYPKTDIREVSPSAVEVSQDAKSLYIKIPNLERRRIYQFKISDLVDTMGKPLRNPIAYYTLNELPLTD